MPGTTAATEPGDAPTPTAAATPAAPADTATGPLLDYLMGG